LCGSLIWRRERVNDNGREGLDLLVHWRKMKSDLEKKKSMEN